MSVECPHPMRQRDELYCSLHRVQALEIIWENEEKELAARRLYLPPGGLTSELTDEERKEFIQSTAAIWAYFEFEVLKGLRSDIDIAEGMALALRSCRDDKEFLNEISARVDELLDER